MTIEQQARALMIRHQSMQNHRQQCMLTRAAAEVGLPGEVVRAWAQEHGKSRPERSEFTDAQVGVS
jgi:NTP pyrophosphatase (non-canonical NTP hydrolase)